MSDPKIQPNDDGTCSMKCEWWGLGGCHNPAHFPGPPWTIQPHQTICPTHYQRQQAEIERLRAVIDEIELVHVCDPTEPPCFVCEQIFVLEKTDNTLGGEG